MILLGAGIVYWYVKQTEITPNDEFFVVSIGPSPVIDSSSWKLMIIGLVENPVNLTYENITSMPRTTITATLKCVSGPYGRAEWTGVKLKYILDMAGIKPGAKEVVFLAKDGFSSSLTINDATADDVLLAYEMNGEPLPIDQGYPLRVVAPDKYGYKWVKWIYEIEVIDYDYKGYWESRGWDDDADITPLAEWSVHAVLLSIAAVFGGLATVSGLKFSRHTTFWKDLPVSRKLNNIFSYIYLAILFPVFSLWLIASYYLRGSIFHTNHGILALTVITLHAVGVISGLFIKENTRRYLRTIHLSSNLLGYLLMLGTIMTGIILTAGSTV
jgi:hypothetical protein